MFKHSLYMNNSGIEIKEVRQWGNSGGVLLSREWIGKQVKITLIDRSLEIKKEVLKILEPWLDDIIGVYLVGSYSRNEQTEDSDVDILAISKKTKKVFISGIYEIEIMPIDNLISLLGSFPIAVYPKILDAKVIINRSFLEEVRKEFEITEESMRLYAENCKKKLRLIKKAIMHDEKGGQELKTFVALYSLVLRLKAFYLMKSILEKKERTNKLFREYMVSKGRISEEQFEEIYDAYRKFARDEKVKSRIMLNQIKSLAELLEKEVDNFNGKKKKET